MTKTRNVLVFVTVIHNKRNSLKSNSKSLTYGLQIDCYSFNPREWNFLPVF